VMRERTARAARQVETKGGKGLFRRLEQASEWHVGFAEYPRGWALGPSSCGALVETRITIRSPAGGGGGAAADTRTSPRTASSDGAGWKGRLVRQGRRSALASLSRTRSRRMLRRIRPVGGVGRSGNAGSQQAPPFRPEDWLASVWGVVGPGS